MVSRRDYSEDTVIAARRVLLEVNRVLGEYQDEIAVIGGWVPELLMAEAEEKHVGSIDVDLALNHLEISEVGYRSIREHLLARGYVQGKEQPFIFHRNVMLGEREISIEVDFLAGEFEGTGKSHRTQRVQDMRPRKAPGVDLVFDMPEKITLRGRLPDGGEDAADIQVASIAAFVVMKAMAMKGRLKEKDAWDIYYCLRNYPGGLDALAEEFRPLIRRGTVREALAILAEKFGSPRAVGPRHAADFLEMEAGEEREILQRDAYERVAYLLDVLGVGGD